MAKGEVTITTTAQGEVIQGAIGIIEGITEMKEVSTAATGATYDSQRTLLLQVKATWTISHLTRFISHSDTKGAEDTKEIEDGEEIEVAEMIAETLEITTTTENQGTRALHPMHQAIMRKMPTSHFLSTNSSHGCCNANTNNPTYQMSSLRNSLTLPILW